MYIFTFYGYITIILLGLLYFLFVCFWYIERKKKTERKVWDPGRKDYCQKRDTQICASVCLSFTFELRSSAGAQRYTF